MALNFKVGSFAKIDTVASQNVPHGLGVTPKAIIFFTAGSNAASGTWSADIFSMLGFVSGVNVGRSTAGESTDALGTSNTQRRGAAKAITFVQPGPALLAEADVSAWDATNFTVNWTTNAGGSIAGLPIMFIALAGADLTDVDILEWTTPAAIGDKTVAGTFSEASELALHISSIDAPPANNTNVHSSFGAMNGAGEQWANAIYAEDAMAAANTSRWQRTDSALVILNANEVQLVRGTFVSMNSDGGFTMNFPTVSGTRTVFSLVLKGTFQSKLGSFNKDTGAAPDAQSVTGVGFPPKGILLAHDVRVADTNPAAQAQFGIGAYDGTNQRAVELLDLDGADPTQADSIWETGKVALVGVAAGSPPVSAQKATANSLDSDGFTITWNPNDAGAQQILYLALGDAPSGGGGPAGLDSMSAEIAFSTDPLSAAPVFTDITPYVLQGNSSRGKQHELGRYEAGELFLKVNNRDGRFDPSNPASPHYPNIDTRKRIRLRATYAGITYPVFDGFIESWTDVSEDRANPEVEIRAVDGDKMLQGRTLTSSYRDAVLAIPGSDLSAFYRCEEPFGSTVLVDDSGLQNHGLFDEVPEMGAQPLIDENGSRSFYFSGDQGRGCLRPKPVPGGQFAWTVAMWIRTGFPAADFRILWQAQTPAGTLDVNGVAMQVAIQQGRLQFLHTQATPFYGAYIGSTYPVMGNITDGQRHFVVISRAPQGAQIKAYVDGVDQSIFLDPGSTPTLPTDLGRMDHMFVGRGPSVAAADDDARFIGHVDEISIWQGKQLSAAEVLNLWNAGSAPWGTDLTSDRIIRVLDAVGWPAGLRNIDVGKSTAAPANQIVGRSALEHMLKMEQAEDGALYFDEECKLTFHNRHWLLMPPQTTSQATFGDGAGELPYLLDRSSKPSRDDVDVINIARGRRRNGPTLKAEDATSKTKYGEKTDDLLELEIVSDLEVQDRVDYRVRRFKDARTRFKQLTITPTTTDPASLFPQALGRKLGDRITVKQRPIPGGWTFTANLRIDRIEHVFTRDQWETTWQLGSVDPDSYWILGTSQLGVDARLAY